MSSLFSALGVAVTGLNAQSASIGNISDDLANAQTTGYKSIGTSFEDFVTASNATSNSPGGVSATPQYQNDVQGNISSTQTSTNLAISGQGFFDVTSAAQSSTGTTVFSGSNFYTRDGDFTLNASGYLVNTAGYYLMGYAINSAGVVDTAATVPIQISALLNSPQPTTVVNYIANVPANAASGYTSSASNVNVYDALGNSHQMAVGWTKTGTNQWIVDVDVTDGSGAGTDYKTQALVTFNSAAPTGTIASVVPITTGTVTATNNSPSAGNVTIGGAGHLPQHVSVTYTPTSGSPVTVTYDTIEGDTPTTIGAALATAFSNSGVTVTNTAGALSVGSGALAGTVTTLGYTVSTQDSANSEAGMTMGMNFAGASSQSIDLNLGTLNGATGVTQYANTNATVSVSSITQDGQSQGSFNNININKDGILAVNYSNGTTRQIYQVPVAQFNSPDNLQRQTGGVYTATLASGTAQLHFANTNGAGSIVSSSLEASTVDIASEFTTMIQSQQIYSANAKLVTTVDNMLTTIIQAVQ